MEVRRGAHLLEIAQPTAAFNKNHFLGRESGLEGRNEFFIDPFHEILIVHHVVIVTSIFLPGAELLLFSFDWFRIYRSDEYSVFALEGSILYKWSLFLQSMHVVIILLSRKSEQILDHSAPPWQVPMSFVMAGFPSAIYLPNY